MMRVMGNFFKLCRKLKFSSIFLIFFMLHLIKMKPGHKSENKREKTCCEHANKVKFVFPNSKRKTCV